MKALEVHAPYGFGALQLLERNDPGPPASGQVLVRISAVSLNHRDLLVVKGFERWRPSSGRIPASDAVGVIEAIGSGVDRVGIGDRVILSFLPHWIDGPMTQAKLQGALGGASSDGVLCERILVDAEAVVKAPEYLTDVEAATLPCAGLTAWHAVSRAGTLDPEKTLLVQGTGGVSLFALQFAKAAGAKVVAISSSDKKLQIVAKLGAAAGINYISNPDWDQKVMELTGGIGVDHVVDIGGAQTLNRSIAAVRCEGIVSVVGLVGGLQAQIDIGPVFLKNIRIDGVETGSRKMLEDMIEFMSSYRLHPVVDQIFPLDEAAEAFQYLDNGAHVGKVCIYF